MVPSIKARSSQIHMPLEIPCQDIDTGCSLFLPNLSLARGLAVFFFFFWLFVCLFVCIFFSQKWDDI